MLGRLFDEFILLSSALRGEYPKSLGGKITNWEDTFHVMGMDIPLLFQVIFNKVSGTKRGVVEQELMDFIPGYRLIHLSELRDEMAVVKEIYSGYDEDKVKTIIPLLANYSSDFICYGEMMDGREIVGMVMHDDPKFVLMYQSMDRFLETICACYKEQVYFLDQDGYLDYDFVMEGEVGARINPEVAYWVE